MNTGKQALERKMALFEDLRRHMPCAPPVKSELSTDTFPLGIDHFPEGRLHNVDYLHFDWINERFFEYLPDPAQPFGFSRSTGEQVIPGRMFTDGGSIPREFWWKAGLSPWEYGPAYLIHDWEFDRHHCQRSTKSFEQVRDTMMEARRTLMALPVVSRRPLLFQLIYTGIDSTYARRAWDGNPGCTLPTIGSKLSCPV